MTGNKAYLAEYQDYNGGPVAFGGSKGYITGKGKIKTGKLDFEDVCFVKELQHFNLFSVSQMCDKKNKVLFTDTECLVLSSDFKLPDENQVLLRIPRQNNMYSFNLENIVPSGGLACLIAKATVDESNKWHRRDIIEFCGSKGIKREYSNARTPQQNRVAERKNKTLIEAARTMLADSFLPNTFWAEAVSTACYVLNRVLVTKPQNKTPYELITGKIPIISYIRPFGCHVTILNTIDHLGKFEGKSDEGFLVGYSLNSKAFRVYNLETKRVEENLHINFLENKPNVAGKGPNWLFDLDYLTDSMNYQPVRSENHANKNAGPEEANHRAGTQDNIDAGNSEKEANTAQDYFVLPIYSSYTSTVKRSEAKNEGEKHTKDTGLKTNEEPEFAQSTEDLLLQAGAARATSTNTVNTVSTPLSTANPSNVFGTGGPSNPNLTNYADQDYSQIPALEDIYGNSNDGIFTNASYDDEGTVADFTNLESTMNKTEKLLAVLVDLTLMGRRLSYKWFIEIKRLQEELVRQKSKQEILKKSFDFANVKTASTDPLEIKALVKDEEAICACSRFRSLQSLPSKCSQEICLRRLISLAMQKAHHLWSNFSYKRRICAASQLAIASFGKHFSRKVTHLFATMLVQPTKDEGAPSERPSEAQPTPSPAPTSEVPNEPQTDSSPAHTSEVPIEQQTDPSPRPSPSTIIPDSIPETSGGNLGGHSSSDKSLSGNEGEMTLQSVYDLCLSLCAQVSDQAKEIQLLKAQIKKFKKQAKPVIKHHRAWLQSVSLKQRLARKSSSKKQSMHKESCIQTREEVCYRVLKGILKKHDRPRPTYTRSLLALKPLPKIDTKDKGKKKIEEEDESESESDGIPEAEKKFK
ncbi:ribonuclease H-like domain-containing protein [Tanacetum coccineum]